MHSNEWAEIVSRVKDLKAILYSCIRITFWYLSRTSFSALFQWDRRPRPENIRRNEETFSYFQKNESTPSLKCSSKVGLMPSCCPGNKALSGKQWGDWCSPIGCLCMCACWCLCVCWRDRLLGSEGRESRQTREEERSTAGRKSVGAQILSFRDRETV